MRESGPKSSQADIYAVLRDAQELGLTPLSNAVIENSTIFSKCGKWFIHYRSRNERVEIAQGQNIAAVIKRIATPRSQRCCYSSLYTHTENWLRVSGI